MNTITKYNDMQQVHQTRKCNKTAKKLRKMHNLPPLPAQGCVRLYGGVYVGRGECVWVRGWEGVRIEYPAPLLVGSICPRGVHSADSLHIHRFPDRRLWGAQLMWEGVVHRRRVPDRIPGISRAVVCGACCAAEALLVRVCAPGGREVLCSVQRGRNKRNHVEAIQKFPGFMKEGPGHGVPTFQTPQPPIARHRPHVRHSVGLLYLHGARDSHPFFPARAASGRCILTAAVVCVPAGIVSVSPEPSSWHTGVVLVAVVVGVGVGLRFLLPTPLRAQVVHPMPRRPPFPSSPLLALGPGRSMNNVKGPPNHMFASWA